METIKIIIAAASIPSAVVGLCFWILQKKIEEREKEREEKEHQQEALQIIILDGVNGAINLSEAVARAVQRIKDAHCNGDMHAALTEIEETKKRQQRMITEAGVHDIMHEHD